MVPGLIAPCCAALLMTPMHGKAFALCCSRPCQEVRFPLGAAVLQANSLMNACQSTEDPVVRQAQRHGVEFISCRADDQPNACLPRLLQYALPVNVFSTALLRLNTAMQARREAVAVSGLTLRSELSACESQSAALFCALFYTVVAVLHAEKQKQSWGESIPSPFRT